MTLEQINSITLEDVFTTILGRMVDFSGVSSEEEEVWTIDSNEDLSMYDRMTLHESLTKPNLADMELELVVFKQELTDDELARQLEVARIQDLKDRFKILKYRDVGMEAFRELFPDIPNKAAYFRDQILKETDKDLAESRLSDIEEEDIQHAAKDVLHQIREIKKDKGRNSRRISENILNLIDGIAIEKKLSENKHDQLQSSFSNINKALKNNRPKKAKNLLQLLSTGINFTQQDKDLILAEFLQSGV